VAFLIVEEGGRPVLPVVRFLCDERDDIANLPTQMTRSAKFANGVPAGSKAYVAEDGSKWVLSPAGTWAEKPSSGGGSSSTVIEAELESGDAGLEGAIDTGLEAEDLVGKVLHLVEETESLDSYSLILSAAPGESDTLALDVSISGQAAVLSYDPETGALVVPSGDGGGGDITE